VTSQIQYDDKIFWDEVDGDIVVCHVDSGQLYYLSETGALVWRMCSQNSVQTIVNNLCAAYSDRDPTQISSDVMSFIEALSDAGLVTLDHDLKSDREASSEVRIRCP
jgi:hypothetical protein